MISMVQYTLMTFCMHAYVYYTECMSINYSDPACILLNGVYENGDVGM